MKIRNAPLARKTRLVSRKELAPGKPVRRVEPGGLKAGRARGETVPASGLKRGGKLPYRSKKAAAKYVTRRKLVADLLERFPICQVHWDGGCRLLSEDIHEPGKRSQGADICDPAECVAACRYCHDAIHANVAEAERRGWLIRSGRPSKAVAR